MQDNSCWYIHELVYGKYKTKYAPCNEDMQLLSNVFYLSIIHFEHCILKILGKLVFIVAAEFFWVEQTCWAEANIGIGQHELSLDRAFVFWIFKNRCTAFWWDSFFIKSMLLHVFVLLTMSMFSTRKRWQPEIANMCGAGK